MKEIATNIPYRCQCGKMQADRYCERCGAALCEECAVEEPGEWYYVTPTRLKLGAIYLCHTCAELEEEQCQS